MVELLNMLLTVTAAGLTVAGLLTRPVLEGGVMLVGGVIVSGALSSPKISTRSSPSLSLFICTTLLLTRLERTALSCCSVILLVLVAVTLAWFSVEFAPYCPFNLGFLAWLLGITWSCSRLFGCTPAGDDVQVELCCCCFNLVWE